jgi:DtxR family Mn-dependent transcriptional regulator
MAPQLSPSTQDYLKQIYALHGGQERVPTSRIAGQMGIAPASVTGMLQKMAAAADPLIDYEKHHGARLTPSGERAALEMIRHHRLLELYLCVSLGYSWDQVHSEADRLEHVISEDFEERISQALGDPRRDPHGEPIPTRELVLPKQSSLCLCDLRPSQDAIIERVENPYPELLRFLGGQGIIPQARIRITGYSPLDQNLSLQVEGSIPTVVLGVRITQQVYVELV